MKNVEFKRITKIEYKLRRRREEEEEERGVQANDALRASTSQAVRELR